MDKQCSLTSRTKQLFIVLRAVIIFVNGNVLLKCNDLLYSLEKKAAYDLEEFAYETAAVFSKIKALY